MIEHDRLKDIKEKYSESFGTLNPMLTEMLECHRMVAGQQWSATDANNSKKKNIIPLTYNYLKGQVDIMCGIQRQTKAALKCYPEETGDNITASISSTILHHGMRKGRGYSSANTSFKDCVTGGLGWLSPYMDFSEDPINGELKVVADSPFDIFFDPHGKEPDTSDWMYIVKRKVISKHIAEMNFSEKADEIRASSADYKSDYFVMAETNLKDKCVIKELWERVLERYIVIYFIDETGELQQLEIPEAQYTQFEPDLMLLRMMPSYEEMKTTKSGIKVAISINDNILAYDGKSPYEMNVFPFVPVFGFYNRSLDLWSQKLSGIVKHLKDVQREINKWESNKLFYLLSSIHSGWMMDKGAVDDIRKLTRGMTAPVLERNPNKLIERIQPPNPPAAMQMQSEANELKFNKIGLSPDALGMVTNAESAKAIQLRQVQGLTKVGELTDNFNYAMKHLGTIALSMMFQFYSFDKVKRILGKDYEFLTEADMLEVKDMKYDIEVDETTYNPTNKRVRLETLMQMKQYQVEGIEAEDFYELWDVDAAEFYKLKTRAEQRRQQQQQMQMQQQAVEQGLLASKAANEKAKTDNMNTQTASMAQNMMIKSIQAGADPEVLRQEISKNMPNGAQAQPEPPMMPDEGSPV